MKLSFSEAIRTNISEATRSSIYGMLEDEFKKISIRVNRSGDTLEATSINASFGSILRKDVSSISINENQSGYVINCNTVYKPSVMFWIFCIIDLVFLLFDGAYLGFFIGIGVALALFFYNKTLVTNGIKGALEKVRNNIG